MSNLKLIEALCQLVEEQSSIICLLSLTLAEASVYCEDIDQKILDAHAKYAAILGADEAPDNLS